MPKKSRGRPRTAAPSRSLASRLRRAREALGLTADEAAAKIGVDRATWYRWESGMMPTLPDGLRAAELLQTDPRVLAFGLTQAARPA